MNSKIENKASSWVIREEEGLTEGDKVELRRWIETTPGACEAMAKMRATWSRFDSINDTGFAQDLLNSKSSWNWKPVAVAATLVLGLGGFIWNLADAPFASSDPLLRKQKIVWDDRDFAELDDGSTIELNSNTEVELQYSETLREIWINHGEAYFSVAKDPNRPFIVYAGNTKTEAIGTEFNVRYTNQAVEVLVAEGNVKFSIYEESIPDNVEESVKETAELTYLSENHQAVVIEDSDFNSGIVIREVSRSDIRKRIAWKPVTLRFESTPLSKVVEEFNNYNHTKIVIEDSELNDIRVAARFRSNKLEGFVRLLEATSGVGSRHEGNIIYIYLKD